MTTKPTDAEKYPDAVPFSDESIERIYQALLYRLGGGADLVEWRWADINAPKVIRQLKDERDKLLTERAERNENAERWVAVCQAAEHSIEATGVASMSIWKETDYTRGYKAIGFDCLMGSRDTPTLALNALADALREKGEGANG